MLTDVRGAIFRVNLRVSMTTELELVSKVEIEAVALLLIVTELVIMAMIVVFGAMPGPNIAIPRNKSEVDVILVNESMPTTIVAVKVVEGTCVVTVMVVGGAIAGRLIITLLVIAFMVVPGCKSRPDNTCPTMSPVVEDTDVSVVDPAVAVAVNVRGVPGKNITVKGIDGALWCILP